MNKIVEPHCQQKTPQCIRNMVLGGVVEHKTSICVDRLHRVNALSFIAMREYESYIFFNQLHLYYIFESLFIITKI